MTHLKQIEITLDIDDQLLSKAVTFAAAQRISLSRLIEEALLLRLDLQLPKEAGRPQTPMPVFKDGKEVKAGINPISNRSLLDAMDHDSRD